MKMIVAAIAFGLCCVDAYRFRTDKRILAAELSIGAFFAWAVLS